jgi:prepilin-type N-terminal cleavage/methylation domain-containing protein/prepilin-type processing-associated H-X9-DG protein
MIPMRRFNFKKARKNGFTLVELLVVMATIGILAVLLLPAIAGTKPNSQAFQCLENQRQMALAWQMYSEDNNGTPPPNFDWSSPGTSSGTPDWVAGRLTLATSSTDNTNTAMLVNHDLYPYASYLGLYLKTPVAFKCPADHSTAAIFGTRLPRVRSISMNNFVGFPSRSNNKDASITNPQGSSKYPPCQKISSLRAPSLTFVVLDEREDSINDGTFFIGADNPNTIIDIPASYHNGSAGFSFADGHSEMHQWTSAKLKGPLQASPINNLNVSGDPAGLHDSYWLCQHALGLGSFP